MNAVVKVEIKPITVIVDSEQLSQRSGISQKGKPYTIVEQRVFYDLGKRFPVEAKLTLEENQPAWPIGEYDLDARSSVYVDRFGSGALSSNPQLVNHRPLRK